MKEKFKKALPKRLLAFALTVAMAVTLLPGMSMVAKADMNYLFEAPSNDELKVLKNLKSWMGSTSFVYENYNPDEDYLACMTVKAGFDEDIFINVGMDFFYHFEESGYFNFNLDSIIPEKSGEENIYSVNYVMSESAQSKADTIMFYGKIKFHVVEEKVKKITFVESKMENRTSFVDNYLTPPGDYTPVYGIFLGDKQVTAKNASDILNNNKASYDEDTNTLSLSGVNITNYHDYHSTYGIYAEGDLNIELAENNIIGTGNGNDPGIKSYFDKAPDHGIFVNGNLNISGSGNLEIIDKSSGIQAFIWDNEGQVNKADLSIGTSDKPFGGKINILDYGEIIYSCAIKSGDISIFGGEFMLFSGSDGIHSEGTVTINNSDISVQAVGLNISPNGIFGESVVINNSKIISLVGVNYSSGSGYASAINAVKEIIISGEKSEVYADATNEDGEGRDDGSKSYGIGSGNNCPKVTITDATVWAFGFTAAIWAASMETNTPLTIGSPSSPMTIKNAKIMADADGNPGEAIEVGSGPIDKGFGDALARERGGRVSALVVDAYDDSEAEWEGSALSGVLIEPKQQSQPSFVPSTSTPSTPEVTVPVSGEGTTNVTAKVEGSNATVSVDTKAINNAAGNTTQQDTDTITVDLSGLTQTVTSVTISKEDAANISSTLNSSANNKEYVEFQMKEYTVKVDSTAMAAVVQAAGGNDLKLVVETTAPAAALNENQKAELEGKEVARTFEAYFVSNGTRISNFNGGTVQVGVVKFSIPEGNDAKYYHVEYLPETGKAERYVTRYMDGHLYFDTTHFSDYAIVYDESMENGTTILVHRLFNKVNGKHLLTIDANEIEHLLASGKWSEDEPIGRAVSEGTAVYRLFNKVSGEHLYTADTNEVKHNTAGKVWVADNNGDPIFYAPTSGKAVFRLFNIKLPGVACHINSADPDEIINLVDKGYVIENDGNPVFYLQ